jgi:hypothetical protein
MLITSAGNVGIGTTTPGALLSANGNILGNGTLALTGTTGTSTIAAGQGFTIGGSQFVVQQGSGNVGIGTTAPTNQLEVDGTSSTSFGLYRFNANTGPPVLYMAHSRSGTIGTNAALLNGDLTGAIFSAGADGTSYANSTSIISYVDAAPSTGIMPGRLVFSTANTSGVVTERMRIDSSGNVGIGTASPSYKLDVNGFINTDGTAGGYKMAGNTVLYASTTNNALAVGASAAAAWMSASSTLWDSVAIGQGALATTPTSGVAQYNTAVGVNALTSNTTGYQNVANGYGALYSNTTGYQNVANGYGALYSNTTGYQNVANGLESLFSNTTGSYNTANGFLALYSNTTGYANTANGLDALFSNTTGSYNTANGYGAFFSATSSIGNTAIGISAGYSISGATGAVGSYNTLFGYESGYGITTGARNVLLGQSTIAGSYNQVTSGSNNIAIGNDVAVPSATASNQLDIGNLIYGTGLSGTGSTVSTGNVGIGTTSPDALLTVGSATPVGNVAHFENSTGSCWINPTTTSLSCSSDARLKTNITDLSDADGLSALLQLNPVIYNWKTESATSSPHTGFIAQDVQKIFPDLVSQGPDGYYTLNYAGFAPYIVKAIQDIADISGQFKVNLIAWFGDSANGIDKLFAKDMYATNMTADTGTFNTTNTHELCIDGACITKAQLLTLLAVAGQQAAPTAPLSTSTSSTGSSTPILLSSPVIQINGNNPAIVAIGTAYADLGASITGPQQDLNLGIATFLNGIKTDTIQLDTSTTSTSTIDYVVTDQFGTTATATRTVIVQPAASI